MTDSATRRPILAISASGPGYDCTLQLGDGTRTHDAGDGGLLPAVARLCATAGCDPNQLGEVRLDLGPGSYTGLRVAVTFARTLGAFAGTSISITTSLELLALRLWDTGEADTNSTVRPILDARRQRFHHAAVRLADRVTLASEPIAVPAEVLLETIEEGEVLLVEDSVQPTVEEVARARGCQLLRLVESHRTRLSDLMLHPKLALRAARQEELEPLYLMGSYAE